MEMQLKDLTVRYNASNYTDYDGTPSKGYSAKITLTTKLGETTTLLNERDITAIMEVVCNRVVANMEAIAQVTSNDIRRAVNGNILEHKPSVDDELPF